LGVIPPKDFDLNNLESLWTAHGKVDPNKKQNIKYEPITNLAPCKTSSVDIKLKLLDDLQFSLSDFGKENKGLVNSGINCFMNVGI